jgi:hypothetical protein
VTQIITQEKQKIPVVKECRFAVYMEPPRYDMPDYHLIKEQIHVAQEDGTFTLKPNILLIQNFKRSFWTTRKGFQNHKNKKEWEDFDKLIETKTSQSQMLENAKKALGTPWVKGDMRKLSASPYLYGSDILSTAVIKRAYMDRFPNVQTKYTMAVYDVETDVINGTEQIIMATVSYKSVVYTVVAKSFLDGIADAQSRVDIAMEKYLSEYVKDRNLKPEMVIVEREIDIIKLSIDKCHELKPDFLAIWNINFDIPKIVAACERARIDPADIFSDPIIPKEYRSFKYIQGKSQKITASGKVTPIKPSAQWHTVVAPASFYVIDAMCAYRHIRTGKAEEQSYSLDSILNKELGVRKLKFKEADEYTGLKWHEFMQTNYKIEYIIYNRFDCISIEVLDEKTTDLSLTLPMFSGNSDFLNFKSQPRRAADVLHYYCLSKNKVIASTGSNMMEDMDSSTLGLDNWIITLPAHLVADNGLKMIEEYPELRSNCRSHVGDLDVSAAYPSNQIVFNVSKETTKKEICNVIGVNDYVARMEGIGLSAGHTNAISFVTNMFNFPQLSDLLDKFKKEI